MFGSGSLEQKLREGNGVSAKATLLSEKDGLDVHSGNFSTAYSGKDLTRLHFRLRVEPEGEEPFEAKIVIRADEMRMNKSHLGPTVAVLYDPTDHSKVAFDFEAMITAHRAERHVQFEAAQAAEAAEHQASAPGDKIERLKELADLRDRGALTDAEFEAEKAKLLQ